MKETSIFPTLLLVAFIILKLLGVINWSWWWVLSPFWIPFLIAVVVFVIFLRCRNGSIRSFKRRNNWQDRLDEMKQRKMKFKDGK